MTTSSDIAWAKRVLADVNDVRRQDNAIRASAEPMDFSVQPYRPVVAQDGRTQPEGYQLPISTTDDTGPKQGEGGRV